MTYLHADAGIFKNNFGLMGLKMAGVIVFFLILAGVLFFPYREVYQRVNRLVDAQKVLTGAALIAFPFIWRVVVPNSYGNSAPAADADFIERLSSMGAIFAQGLSWIIAVVGIVMIGYAIWQAREHRKAMLNKKGMR